MASRTDARSSLTVVRRQVVGTRGEIRYGSEWGAPSNEGPLLATGGSMDVIFRREGSVRTSAFSTGFTGRDDDEEGLPWRDGGLNVGFESMDLLEPGRRDCVRNVRLVSTSDSFTRMLEQISSIISSSLRKLTSRFVGCTLTSTR